MEEGSVVKEYLTTAVDGKNYRTKFYNLDVIISVGYRVKSHRGTQFRICIGDAPYLLHLLRDSYACRKEPTAVARGPRRDAAGSPASGGGGRAGRAEHRPSGRRPAAREAPDLRRRSSSGWMVRSPSVPTRGGNRPPSGIPVQT